MLSMHMCCNVSGSSFLTKRLQNNVTYIGFSRRLIALTCSPELLAALISLRQSARAAALQPLFRPWTRSSALSNWSSPLQCPWKIRESWMDVSLPDSRMADQGAAAPVQIGCVCTGASVAQLPYRYRLKSCRSRLKYSNASVTS